jgi:hypothetical protein
VLYAASARPSAPRGSQTIHTLARPVGYPKTTFHIPYAKQPSKLRQLLSREESRRLFAAAATLHHRTLAQRVFKLLSTLLPHLMTSSANSKIEGGTSSPSAFAVLRLMMSSNFVDCITGRSAGLVPLRTRPV